MHHECGLLAVRNGAGSLLHGRLHLLFDLLLYLLRPLLRGLRTAGWQLFLCQQGGSTFNRREQFIKRMLKTC